MNATAAINPESISLLREGWRLLIAQLGIQKATKFIVLIERGQGDTVNEIANYWRDLSIDDIHRKVIDWKKNVGKSI
ncbi:MAG: hypothetical protein OMM_07180 [Candidatus Magnetoglobus multicellularis str. Araruama]|uniref:Uncharacterized protein n=1 Tax=Candidatus Magnetoglobus multicellularis str. Araruama TaxID=890399 RepID=A0A1V1PDT5_9BACT|nr:MAG: hypothetical protein OMM_07180 [Candidatus Magnetoglobus multicellularis str. Araruama]